MSQRVNLRWGDKSQQLREIYRDKYGSNSILRGKVVLCIGLDLFPPGKPRGLKRVSAHAIISDISSAICTKDEIAVQLG